MPADAAGAKITQLGELPEQLGGLLLELKGCTRAYGAPFSRRIVSKSPYRQEKPGLMVPPSGHRQRGRLTRPAIRSGNRNVGVL